MTDRELAAEEALVLLDDLAAAGVRCWLMGGWGIDALLGERTRTHHDLDLLVDVSDLPLLEDWLRSNGFERLHPWEENLRVPVGDRSYDTAFVERHADGRELDVHGVHVEDGGVRPAAADPWTLPAGSLTGTGTIAGRPVRCVTAAAQRALHRGYDLPETHRGDLRRLERVDGPPGPRAAG